MVQTARFEVIITSSLKAEFRTGGNVMSGVRVAQILSIRKMDSVVRVFVLTLWATRGGQCK